ncbi:MAG TPA: S41 family peptidase, partial [Turneriella sp.]|nr:S41 family peptidase [Turneriella sp.]
VATPRLPVEHTLLGEAAQRDFRIINAIFARSHATAFKQIPAGEAPELFHAKERVPLPVFLSRILKYYGNLHADHTMVGFPPELIEKYGLKNRFFPFPLKFFDKHAYLDTQLSGVPYGAELVDINGKSIHSILQSFAEFPRARATDEPWTSFYLSEQFASWYFLTSKSGAPWRLQFAGLPQETQLVTPNILPQRVSSVRNYWKSILSSMFMDKKKIAYFAINSFFPTNTPYATFEKWVEYFGAFNTEARHRGSTTLILDLRVNRGGVMSLAAASAAWFIETTIVDKSTSRVHTRLLPYREFATAINGQAAKNSDFDQL